MMILDLIASRYHAARSDPGETEVRAMPMVLRIERVDPPSRTALLEAAAASAVAVCLDPRSDVGGEWHEAVRAWVAGRIRKVSRRARGVQWEAVQDLPGVTITVDGASVRSLLPVPVSETPREVAKLQISGSDLPLDEPGPVPEGARLLYVNPRVEMSAGKLAAQVGHASMLLAPTLPVAELKAWAALDYRCAVRTPAPAEWDSLIHGGDVVAVRDAGFTEVAPGTTTVLAV
ncbi:Peptidyl-tRNA hydrolase [Lentzea xinjiangensis]|uniref:peptidyl-tRNA hydrolase n=1 Tax=Lentzea xinjiangensis TaxID=402600 RepID=A0A1H9URE8_9PSEU|nr:peptidyl-tRNA hydrolase [Lentzea xinjiangensis]SES11972.1 Peptidyl-tRNA hydrolase [Lentzea xinjiangensis]